MTNLTGKVALVTGAASGIGKGIATRFVADGARVIVTDLDGAAANQTAAALGDAAQGMRLDVTSRASVEEAVSLALAQHGRIDVIVNNAGWDKVGPFVDSNIRDWDRVIAINLYGALHVTQVALPALIAQGSGSVINLGSDAARVGSTGEAVYSAAKGGIVAFTKTLAREVAQHGIRTNSLCPGPTDTPLFADVAEENPKLRAALERSIPLRRLAQPADLAAAAAFLASDDSEYITGQTLSVSGGLTMA